MLLLVQSLLSVHLNSLYRYDLGFIILCDEEARPPLFTAWPSLGGGRKAWLGGGEEAAQFGVPHFLQEGREEGEGVVSHPSSPSPRSPQKNSWLRP